MSSLLNSHSGGGFVKNIFSVFYSEAVGYGDDVAGEGEGCGSGGLILELEEFSLFENEPHKTVDVCLTSSDIFMISYDSRNPLVCHQDVCGRCCQEQTQRGFSEWSINIQTNTCITLKDTCTSYSSNMSSIRSLMKLGRRQQCSGSGVWCSSDVIMCSLVNIHHVYTVKVGYDSSLKMNKKKIIVTSVKRSAFKKISNNSYENYRQQSAGACHLPCRPKTTFAHLGVQVYQTCSPPVPLVNDQQVNT